MRTINRLLNPDFMEYGNIIVNNRYFPNNWSPYGTISGDTSLGLVITTVVAYTFDRAFEMYKVGANNTGMGQTIDFEYDISGLEFDIGMWIRVYTQTGDSGIKLSYKWLDSAGSLIGSQQTIATITTTQNYTLHSVSAVTAPATAQKIWLGVETIGSNQPLLAYVDSPYVYGGYMAGLRVSDDEGNNSLIFPDMSSIISVGTISLLDTLEDDGTYGVDIDLPGDEYIDTKDIGVIVQARDFDWDSLVNIVSYDSGNKFWGSFFANNGTTYYRKLPDGVMEEATFGDMTDPLINVSLVSCWDRYAKSIKKVRLFGGVFYHFLKTVSGGEDTVSLYARDYGNNDLGHIGYMLSLGQGDIEKYETAQSTAGYTIHFSTVTDFTISVVRENGAEVTLGSNVASHTFNTTWGGAGTQGGQYNATWDCPGYGSWATTDSLRFIIKIVLKANSWPLGSSQQTITKYISFLTPKLGWTTLDASTWTLYRYLQVEQDWYNAGTVRAKIMWGTSTKEVKGTNIKTTAAERYIQPVYSLGSNGVSEVDYMIYLKNYKGN